MKLYLIQHGEACDKAVDPERPLTDNGKADVNRLAVYLRKNNIQVDRVIHSGKLRAQQTVERLLNSVGNHATVEVSDKIGPNSVVEEFSELSFTWEEDTLIVSHMPFLAKLVSQLCIRNTDTLFANCTPGSALCLQRNDLNQWQINWMVRPDSLK